MCNAFAAAATFAAAAHTHTHSLLFLSHPHLFTHKLQQLCVHHHKSPTQFVHPPLLPLCAASNNSPPAKRAQRIRNWNVKWRPYAIWLTHT